ncbi:hypothetical protein BZG35_14100 [Brevundimonas sp. LM2]|nr:hypothetical protein BZG35_14100 [Brevundimonas sp. LM2]
MVAAALLAGTAAAQDGPARAPRPEITAPLAMFDGVWIGPARMTLPDGSVRTFEQMERIGPMLGGEIRVMEGKARGSDGATLFNAFTVFSEGTGGGIEMRSHVWGDESARAITMKPDGYVWRMDTPGGPITYDITVRDGVWHETGVITLASGAQAAFFEMTLTRKGDSDWPAANAAFPTTD